MFGGATLPVSLYGFSGFGDEAQDWIDVTLKPIADIVKKYYDLQSQQNLAQQQQVLKSTTMPSLGSISPIYLVIGAGLIWYLLKSNGIKGKKGRR